MPWVTPEDLHLTVAEMMDHLDGKTIARPLSDGVLLVAAHKGQYLNQYGSQAWHPDEPGWGFFHQGASVGAGWVKSKDGTYFTTS